MQKFKETSMAAIFQNRVAELGDRTCVMYKKGGKYVDLTWNEMNTMVLDLACYLLSLGVKKGDKIGLFSNNRYEWWVADLAIISIGAVNVPIYSTNSAPEAQYVLENSDSRLCFCGKKDQLEKVLEEKKKLPKVKDLVAFDEPDKSVKGAITYREALEIGKKHKKVNEVEKRIKAIKPQDMATIIYTSGTTGNPKGVMLTHDNFVQDMMNTTEDIKDLFTKDDIFLSFLPLSHSLERTAGEYAAIFFGSKTAFAEDVSTLMQNFGEVRPTILVSVPRIYEKVHSGILAKVADAPGIKKKIFNFAMKTAKKNLPYQCTNKPRTGLFKIRYNLADKLVFSKLKATLGLDKLKFAISGGGPLSVNDAEFFLGMGITILEGFGLTETTPVTNYNRPGKIKIGTVGPAIPKTKLKIAEDGELLIKGPQVMKGYFKNPKATKEVFTKDGYFRTGDIAVIDEDGFLSITGRLKDIIVTAGGKNISPQNIENSLKTSKFIEQAAIIGDRRKYLSALVVPAFEALEKWAKQSGISFTSKDDLITKDEVKKIFEEELNKYTKQFSRVEQIRKFTLLNAEWTQETEELTPTQKVKRRVIEKKYAKEIEGMYSSDMD